jgi:hypothetical protein
VKGSGTGPVSRQLQDKVGGVVPAGLSLIKPRVTIGPPQFGCGEHVMKNIADLLKRFRQRSQPASVTQLAAMVENRDRSSMADFVRILQSYDHGPCGSG